MVLRSSMPQTRTRNLRAGTATVAALVAASLLPGCAAESRDIAPTGEPDGYALTESASPTRGGGMEPGRVAIEKADAFCRARARRFVPVDIAGVGWPEQDPITGARGVTLSFRCATPRGQQMNVGAP